MRRAPFGPRPWRILRSPRSHIFWLALLWAVPLRAQVASLSICGADEPSAAGDLTSLMLTVSAGKHEFRAVARNGRGKEIRSVPFWWSSSDTTVVTVSIYEARPDLIGPAASLVISGPPGNTDHLPVGVPGRVVVLTPLQEGEATVTVRAGKQVARYCVMVRP